MPTRPERRLDPPAFGKILKALRLARNISVTDAARASGVPDHTLTRLETGEIDKPSFQDVVSLGFHIYGLSPDHMAALAGLYPAPEADDETYPQAVVNVLQRLRLYLSDQDRTEQIRFSEVLDSLISVSELRRGRRDGGSEIEELPSWVRALTDETAVTLRRSSYSSDS